MADITGTEHLSSILTAALAAVSGVVGAWAGAKFTVASARKRSAEADSMIAKSAGDLLDLMRKDLAGALNRISVLEAAFADKSKAYETLQEDYHLALRRIGELEAEIRDLRRSLEEYEHGRSSGRHSGDGDNRDGNGHG